jgi:hypothetical protein
VSSKLETRSIATSSRDFSRRTIRTYTSDQTSFEIISLVLIGVEALLQTGASQLHFSEINVEQLHLRAGCKTNCGRSSINEYLLTVAVTVTDLLV